MSTHPTLDLSHTAMSEEDALRLLDGHRITMGDRTMDPKAQIVGEFVKSIRVPGYYPPLPELRQQLRVMVSLMDEPAPALTRIEDILIPGPAGGIPARVYSASAATTPLPAVVYFHGGGWVQGDLETHHGLCARLAKHAGVLVVAVDYRLAPEHKFPAAVDDCLAAYRWARAKGRDVGADPARVAVAGADVPGAHLSRGRLLAGYRVAPRDGGGPRDPARARALVHAAVSAQRGGQDGSARLAAARVEPQGAAAGADRHRRLRSAARRGPRVR